MPQDTTPLNLDRGADLKTLTDRAARKWGDKIGLVFDEHDERLTYEDIDQRSNAIANVLQKIGVEPGDRVGVMLRNRAEFPLTWLALAKIGATMVPINVFYKDFDAQYILEHSETTMVITSSEFIPLIRKIQQSVPTLKEILSVDGPDSENARDMSKLLAEVSTEPTTFSALPESLANIQYTSGTTGRPKGCMLSQRYWVTLGRKHVEDLSPALGENDVMLIAQPFYYMDPQWNVATSLTCGAPLVVLDRFHPSTFWEKVREYGITFFYCLGAMPTLMFKMPPSPLDRENHVRHVACSAIPIHLHRELEARWDAPWHEVYGMTETGSVVSVKPEEHDELVGTGCIGRPPQNREVRIIGDDGRSVSRGQAGEIAVRGVGLMDGYYRNQEATDTAFRNGWFHTGDLARMDENGLVFYTGRKKEMIRRSGENISAAEVEDIIKLHPNVRFVACVPVPDELRGEEVKAYVVLQPGETRKSVNLQQLIDFCSERLAYFKVPRYWEYRDDLPLTPSERVAKHVLRDEKPNLRSDSYDRVDGVWG